MDITHRPGTPAPDATPQAGTAPAPAVSAQPQVVAAPRTAQDVADLLARRNELSTQLRSANTRRAELSRSLRTVGDPVDRTGLEQRLSTLDQHINQIESDVTVTEQQLAQAPAGSLRAATEPPFVPAPRLASSDWAPVTVSFMFIVLAPLSFAYARRLWKRPTAPLQPTSWPEAAARLERMEQAVDAIAIEVERVSEGQRFMTRVLTEQPARNANAGPVTSTEAPAQPALGAGEAPFQAVHVRDKEAVR